ncbi:MAG: Tat pathway signal protein, partial [Alphaproteobacteria bacterium]|nr:Tat pathway signal protein [Alphaproteobacteria bacterium]
PIAERWLARAVTLSDDPLKFLTQPWSLFFLLLAVFSLLFPFYQSQLGKSVWTRFFTPALLASLAIPLAMMGGVVRPAIAGLLVLAAIGLALRSGRDTPTLKIPTGG